MPIVSIKRDFIGSPNIVRIESTDDLETITAPNYLITQKVAISLLNNGEFEWVLGDMVLIYYADGEGFFTHDVENSTFIALVNNNTQAEVTNYTTVAITPTQFKGMYAAPIQLLPAQGANKLIVLVNAKLAMTHNFVLYQNGGNVAIQYDDTVNGGGTLASTTVANTLFNIADSAILQFNPSTVSIPYTDINTGLYLSNASAAFTAGDSSMVMNLWWRTITVE